MTAIRKRLGQAVAEGPILADGRKVKVSARVGAAIVGPGESGAPEQLLARAEAALPIDAAPVTSRR